MRRAAKVDDNQGAVVSALETFGARVQSLAMVGHGCPDLLVAYKGAHFLLEVKDGKKVSSARKLTPAQKSWHGSWPIRVCVVESADEALRAIGAIP